MNKLHPIIVIGAGLSGLYLAWKLQKKSQKFILLEGRNSTGGRILSSILGKKKSDCVDMGPAWVWPDLQPRLTRLITELDVKLFKQYTTGDMLYERDTENIESYSGQSSHNNSYRIAGGAQALIFALEAELKASCIYLNAHVLSIEQDSLKIETQCNNKAKYFSADKIVFAMPPRLIQHNIKFNPPLSSDIKNLWKSVPTWMAGHCKIVFIYAQAFWRKKNLSGEVFSQCGPLTEIYDGSPENESFYALTSFVGLNSVQRQQLNREKLIEICFAQLERLFGAESRNIIDVKIKDWSCEQYTNVQSNAPLTAQHPQYPESAPRSFCDNKIILAGTEVAREHGGYIEGALESADDALLMLDLK